VPAETAPADSARMAMFRELSEDMFLSAAETGLVLFMALNCWASSTFLCSYFLADLLVSAFPLRWVVAACISAGVAAMFIGASWARLGPPGTLRDLAAFTCALTLGAWALGAARHINFGSLDSFAEPWVAISSAFVSNMLVARMADKHCTPGNTNHNLYRFYDVAGKLLYVGITSNPRLRFAQHRKLKPWWNDIATREIVHYRSRAELAAAEIKAIKKERPLYNIAHAGARR
jgi:predicted GIY-YIG superfamily endonuclease